MYIINNCKLNYDFYNDYNFFHLTCGADSEPHWNPYDLFLCKEQSECSLLSTYQKAQLKFCVNQVMS